MDSRQSGSHARQGGLIESMSRVRQGLVHLDGAEHRRSCMTVASSLPLWAGSVRQAQGAGSFDSWNRRPVDRAHRPIWHIADISPRHPGTRRRRESEIPHCGRFRRRRNAHHLIRYRRRLSIRVPLRRPGMPWRFWEQPLPLNSLASGRPDRASRRIHRSGEPEPP